MKNLQATHSTPAFLPGFLITLSLGLMVACGGSSTPAPTAPPPLPGEGLVASDDSASIAVDPGFVAPEIPQAASAAPASLMAELVLGNPNEQLTQLGLFADGVSAGAGAFITPLTFLQMLGSLVGGSSIEGLNLNAPLYVLVLDSENVVLVATTGSEGALRSSVEGGQLEVMTHGGFAAIGAPAALTAVAPYALSNLVHQKAPSLPTVNFHVAKVMAGAQGDDVNGMIMDQLERLGTDKNVMSALLDVLGNLSMMRVSLDASQRGVTLHMESDVTGGPVLDFLGSQRPSDFSMMERVGTGPWGIAVAGRLDFSVFAPLLVAIGEAEANPILTQIAAQVPSLNGEMAFGINAPESPEFAMGMDLTDAKGISQIVNALMSLASKQKNHEFDGMKATLKLASIKTRGGSLHELRAKAKTKQEIERYGKGNVSGFMGVAVNSLIVTFGKNAKKHAKILAAASGKISGKGTQLSAAIALAKSARESLLIAVDGLSLSGARPPKDVEPMVLGIGFENTTVRARVVVPMDHVKEATKLF